MTSQVAFGCTGNSGVKSTIPIDTESLRATYLQPKWMIHSSLIPTAIR
jgi:hypothetical protein